MEVVGDFTSRGGIDTTVRAAFGEIKPGSTI